MKKLIPFLTIAVIAITIGCSKSSKNTPTPLNTGGPTSSNQLLVSTVTLGFEQPLTDTFTVTKYKYDIENRVIYLQ